MKFNDYFRFLKKIIYKNMQQIKQEQSCLNFYMWWFLVFDIYYLN